jgi:aldehyde:ferredoxin oxidoreductase
MLGGLTAKASSAPKSLGGFTGKILRVNLTTKAISQLQTAKYEDYGGGHGMGSAIFFDLVGNQLPFTAFDPRNMVIMMASPFAGTFMPGSGRCEVQSLSPMLYPIEWFGHSNFGGRFTAQLKFAGWDGIVVEGASDKPVYINIMDDKVKIEDANGIWGKNTWESQQEISKRVFPKLQIGEWAELAQDCFTTQVPAVVTCGPVGEAKSRLGCLLHGPGSQAALCGFGGVFGSKKLKAISVIGTGSAPIADPKAFMDARIWFKQFQWDVDNPRDADKFESGYSLINGAPKGGNVANRLPSRAAACASCPRGCKERTADGSTNEAVCAGTMTGGNDVMHRWGAGHWQVMATSGYISALTRQGIFGKGKEYDPGDMPAQGGGGFGGGGAGGNAYWEALYKKMATRDDKFSDLIAEGAARIAEKLGRYPQDINNGTVKLTYWGTQEHYTTQVQVDWGYGSLFGERDLMLHQMSNYPLHWMAQTGNRAYLNAEQASKLYGEAMVPYEKDRFIMDYSENPETGIYSDSKLRLVAWVKHYEKFWIGMGLCGWRWPQCITNNTEDRRGATPNAEPKFWNAVTGKNLTFADAMEIGHKIYTLDRSIWVLQGRTKKLETFPDYIYNQGAGENILPMYIDGQWKYDGGRGRKLDREKFEDFKTRFYKFEGYNPENGFPTAATLDKMKMPNVAAVLKKSEKLG